MFTQKLVNRRTMPTKNVLICEDCVSNQAKILAHFSDIFDSEGLVQFHVVAGGFPAAKLIEILSIDLILLDHDMPLGDGCELLTFLKKVNKNIPIITFSGMDCNNQKMMQMGATYMFNKHQVMDGKADDIIRQVLGVSIHS